MKHSTKMYKLLAVLCISLFVRTVYSAVAFIPPTTPPQKYANEKGCYIETLDKVLPVNQPYSPQDGKSCIQYTCGSDGYTQVFTCGVVYAPNCTPTQDLTLPYPDCCSKYDNCPPSKAAVA